MVRIPRVTRDTLARCEAAVAFVLAGHAALLWATADTGLWAWSITGFLGLLGTLGLVGILRPSSDAVAAVRGALAVATAVLVGEATGSLTGLFWAWFMGLALLYPLVLPLRAAAGYVLGLRTPQMNKDHDYNGVSENQLRALERLGLLSAAWRGDAVSQWKEQQQQAGQEQQAVDAELKDIVLAGNGFIYAFPHYPGPMRCLEIQTGIQIGIGIDGLQGRDFR